MRLSRPRRRVRAGGHLDRDGAEPTLRRSGAVAMHAIPRDEDPVPARHSLLRPLVVGALVAFAAGPAHAGDGPATPVAPIVPKPVDLPPGVVARVRGRDLTVAEFEARLVDRMKGELTDPQSSAMGVLQIVIEETVVAQEAARLGIRVTTEDYDRSYAEIDLQVRNRFGGEKTLATIIKEQGLAPEEFRRRVEEQIRKERIASDPAYLGNALPKDPNQRLAQVEVVIKQLIKKAAVELASLPVGVVAKVNGAPVTAATFGASLRSRLAESEVRRILNEVCITMLLDQEGLEFAQSQVDEELQFDRPLWQRMRAEALTPEKRELTFEGFLQIRYNSSIEELHTSAYRRGLFALRRKLRVAVTDDDVMKAWSQGSQGPYGASYVATDIMVSFQIPNAVMETVKRRTLEEARRIVADLSRRLSSGEPLASIEAEIKARGDRSMLVEHRAVVNEGNDLPIFAVAATLKDGQWSQPLEQISEIHLVRRESFRPAPKLDDVRPVVRQHLVDQRAQLWLQDRMRDDVIIGRR